MRIQSITACQLSVFIFCVLFGSSVQAESNWANWRGPSYDGHSDEAGLPTEFSDKDIDWKVDLPGIGQSSPAIWGERIFLTTALDGGKQRVVFCLDRNDGRMMWKQTSWTGSEVEPIHRMNSWASTTCATDGEHVYAFFGRGGGLHCYTVSGEHVWSRDLGAFASPWGTAACPLLVGDLVIQNCDADEDAYITALDKKTGKTVWKTKRDNKRGWSSPIVIDTGKRKEVVVNGHTGARGYDPKTGKDLWFAKSVRGRGTPTVTPGNGRVHVLNGLSGAIYSVIPGGSGDISDTKQIAWSTIRKGGRDLPSPIIIGGSMLVMGMKGVLSRYDVQTGEESEKIRVGGNYSASPIAYSGMAAFISESGETVLIKPGKTPEVVSRSQLTKSLDEEIFRSSITPTEGQLFIRTTHTLYCIGDRKAAK